MAAWNAQLWVMPCRRRDGSGGYVFKTAGWGDGRGHRGVDIGTTDGMDYGFETCAPIGGKVVRASNDGPFRPPNGHTAGYNIWFEGDDGSHHKFFHLVVGVLLVAIGQHVKQGQPIARYNASGTLATHGHWEVHDGSWSNPIDFEDDVDWLIRNNRWADTIDQGIPPADPNEEDELMAAKDEIISGVMAQVRQEFSNKDGRDVALAYKVQQEALKFNFERLWEAVAVIVEQVNHNTEVKRDELVTLLVNTGVIPSAKKQEALELAEKTLPTIDVAEVMAAAQAEMPALPTTPLELLPAPTAEV